MHADRSRHDRGIRRDWAVLWLVAIVMLASAAPAARAQQSPWVTETQSDAGWIVTLGGYGDLEPQVRGRAASHVLVSPDHRLSHRGLTRMAQPSQRRI